MKVYKKKELSLAVKPFGMAGRQYLSFAVMVFFDLTAPDDLLTDQDLWRDAPAQLGPVPVIDTGMPKERAEFLVAGSCFAPRGQTVPASRIRVRVGDVHKNLNILGDRYFLHDGALSEPRPFSEMPIIFENAFGGEGFDKNPVGKGLTPVKAPDGHNLRPLPNIEHPSRMIGGPDDRPDPAGLRMLDVMWRPRASMTGTYDDRWLAERWPDFPDDMDHAFFNAAQADQWASGFFKGDEIIEIDNMHPDLRRVVSRLPGVRVRLFATLARNFKRFHDKKTFTEEFTDIPTRIDTVWLFPTILRGLCVFRGTTPNLDDEYHDLIRVYLDYERLSEPMLPIEEYLERQRKAMDLTVPIDMAPFEAASKDLAGAMKTLKNSPKEVERVKKAILGQEPVMPRSSADMVKMGERTAGINLKTLDEVEKVARDLHGRFGHLVKIDLKQFDTLRTTVRETMDAVRETAANVAAAEAKAHAAKDETLKEANAFMARMGDPAHHERFGMHPSMLDGKFDLNMRYAMPSGTDDPWHDAGFPLVVEFRRALEDDPEVQSGLRALGLPERVVRRAWLGINAEERREDPVKWGLAPPPAPGQPAPPPLVIPPGLVLPRFDGPKLNRVLVRADISGGDYTRFASDVLLDGSAEVPLALAPAESGGYYVRVDDELQALFMEEEVGDACGVVALVDPGQTPDDDTTKAIAERDVFLIIMPEGTTLDAPDWAPWPRAHENARLLALPKGKTVFEARAKGVDIRRLVMEALPPDFAKRHRIGANLPEPGEAPTRSPVPPLPFPKFDFAKDAADCRAKLEARYAPVQKDLEAMRERMEAKFAGDIVAKGGNPDLVKARAAVEAKSSPKEWGQKSLDKLMAEKDRLKKGGMLSPEVEKRFGEIAAKAQAQVDWAGPFYEQEMARVEAAKKTFAEAATNFASLKLPGKAGEEMAAAGLDPELLAPLTREDVVARYEAGLPFARRVLSGLDLSKLKLPGIDLSEAILEGTSFVKTDLTGARLKKAIAKDADFTKANLSGADLEMGAFLKAKLKKADLSRTRLYQTIFQEADLTKADLRGANLELAIIQDCKLGKAEFSESTFYLSLIHGSDMKKADFRDARLKKTMIRMLDCSKVRFDRAALNDVMLHAVTGEEVSFREADLTRFRTGFETKLPGADFRGARLHEACLRETDLPKADFAGSDLTGALFELCDMTQANLKNVPAKGASLLKCDLAAADLRGINLMTGSLRKSRLSQTDLGHANLYGVDLYKVIVGETNFNLANLKMTALHRRVDLIK